MQKKIITAASVAALAFGGAFASIASNMVLQTAYVAVKQFVYNPNWQYVPVANVPNGTCDSTVGTNCLLTINLTGGRTGITVSYTDASHITLLKGSHSEFTLYNVSAPFTPEVVK